MVTRIIHYIAMAIDSIIGNKMNSTWRDVNNFAQNCDQLPRSRLGLAKTASVLASVLRVNCLGLASVLGVGASVLVSASTKVSWSHH